MSVERPGERCAELAFASSWPLGESAQLALEDYARVTAGAEAAQAVRAADDPLRVTGVHVCGLPAVSPALRADIEGFARDLASRSGEGGLGWS